MAKRHGMSSTPTYTSWTAMIQRCTYTKSKSYPRYGGKGVTVCDAWLDFNEFFADMGPRPGKEFTLNRKDNSLGYGPRNCEWATATEQARNKGLYRGRVKANSSGVAGVYWVKHRHKWQACIQVSATNRKTLGLHDNIFDAAAARISAQNRYWTESSTSSQTANQD